MKTVLSIGLIASGSLYLALPGIAYAGSGCCVAVERHHYYRPTHETRDCGDRCDRHGVPATIARCEGWIGERFYFVDTEGRRWWTHHQHSRGELFYVFGNGTEDGNIQFP